MDEEFRIIAEIPKYSVSNLGNIRNNRTGKIMKSRVDKDGYLYLGLFIENKIQKFRRVHRLVAITFLENIDNLQDIDHINQIKTDNRLENLRWVSASNNNRNKKKREGLTSNYKGVSWDANENKWATSIKINGISKNLGKFDTEIEAYSIWCACVYENNLQDFYGI
jgi:hypothetical protein